MSASAKPLLATNRFPHFEFKRERANVVDRQRLREGNQTAADHLFSNLRSTHRCGIILILDFSMALFRDKANLTSRRRDG